MKFILVIVFVEEIPEILNRHSTLKQANLDLIEQSEQVSDHLDSLRSSLIPIDFS